MKVRLGYVAISNKLGKKVTSSSTVTFSNYSKIISEEKKLEKLKAVILSNLNDLEKIIKYNIENKIHFYRITSALIPLVTHPSVGYYGHKEIFKREFIHIGNLIKSSNMRVDIHPDQFNVLNSNNEEVVNNTIKNLNHQLSILKSLEYKKGKMVLHIGGATGGKDIALERFKETYKKLPGEIKDAIILENDDKIYTATETLKLCKELNIPMVLDVHHHNCNNYNEDIIQLLDEIFSTWDNEEFIPKIHFSSPLEGKKDRRHAPYINAEDFKDFIYRAKEIDRDFDVMLECKEKDMALYKLVDEIKDDFTFIDKSTFQC